MKNLLLLLLSLIFLSSCRLSYYYPAHSQNRVDKVLGVTQEGDTIQVPIDYFGDRTQTTYDFNLEYFFWRNDWHLYNPNIYNRRWFVNNLWWNPYTPFGYPTYIYRPNNIWRPAVQEPRRWRTRTNIEQRRNQVQPNRGRSNQTQVRQPVYNRPIRGKVTTPPPTPSNRNSTVRSNNNSRTTTGGRPIKQ
jgi:hypothetical protein